MLAHFVAIVQIDEGGKAGYLKGGGGKELADMMVQTEVLHFILSSTFSDSGAPITNFGTSQTFSTNLRNPCCKVAAQIIKVYDTISADVCA